MNKKDSVIEEKMLKKMPVLEKIMAPFLADFSISWQAELIAYNTTLYPFIIKPSFTFAETFGLEYELLLVYTPYDSMQARTMQAINSIFSRDPAKGRVENLICVVVSDAPNAKDWLNTYAAENQDLRTYVVFSKESLLHRPSHSMLSEFRKQLAERDLFDVQLPLLNDMYFFGRQTILQTLQDNIKRSENSGIFGLRKTGKTSLLYKIKRTIESAEIGKVFLYDAKSAKIRMRSWSDLMLQIMKEICNAYALSYNALNESSPIEIVEAFESIVKSIPKSQRTVIIIDEIEYISFNPPLDSHWEKEFFNFWQFLWSMQSTYRNICFVIAGVNPMVAEVSSIKAVQNPLFGIVNCYYLQGLEKNDIHEMSRRIGRRLGLKFDHTAIDYLFSQYGGHPLLTRLALSYENKNATTKPVTFTAKTLMDTEVARENELVPYCQHIVDVLKDFYPDEYTLLEFLAIGATQDFIDLAPSPMTIAHLKNYGLLVYDNHMPKIGIPVVANYIKGIQAKMQGAQIARFIVPVEQRTNWLQNIVKSIISYMRQLEIAIRKGSTPLLFGSNSFPEADKLLEIPVATNENDFKVFISTFSNCFVESIVNYGKSISNSNYFWTTIKDNYQHLFDALLRVKAYRNRSEHLKLTPQMQEIVDRYLYIDLEGKNICDVTDANFVLQQCVAENLKLAISIEISILS
nr:ATP-binding protein [uncultured Acetatifactor sp.]